MVFLKKNKMKITIEKDKKPFIISRPWIIKVDGYKYSYGFKSKKKAIEAVESTGNIVSNG